MGRWINCLFKIIEHNFLFFIPMEFFYFTFHELELCADHHIQKFFRTFDFNQIGKKKNFDFFKTRGT
ncbi:hypothetical protein LEP1GSC125_1762 [Leptospira mayottensis 200901122]|uniref:Uncharacterized protein n=1 Tax=Leptospira mayottensis 200901122 TaxID=1193010 RepID=A0AA87SV27_9LEPT|nr:hypothetical protein LEP1GSC125_1762 [Leptospira mayottensis 200901122]